MLFFKPQFSEMSNFSEISTKNRVHIYVVQNQVFAQSGHIGLTGRGWGRRLLAVGF